MTTIKDAKELLPLLREARRTKGNLKISISGKALEQVIDAMHLREAAGRNPNVPALANELFEMKYMNQLQALDIQDYVACVLGMIQGKSPCDWCEEQNECQRNIKGGVGCSEWWLRFREGKQ